MMAKTALLLIDFQNDYFENGAFPLVGTEAAAQNAKVALDTFRARADLIVHVRHHALESDAPFFVPGSHGAEIHEQVAPAGDEIVVTKSQINVFLDTDIDTILRNNGITSVVVVGAMSHMCVDAAVRAASDKGYQVTVLHDAVATRDLEFGDQLVPASQVHAAFMSALAFAYAELISVDEYVKRQS